MKELKKFRGHPGTEIFQQLAVSGLFNQLNK